MTSTPTEARPEVAAFVAAVRDRLADLSEDEREELAGGLEADLSELVAERGPEALGDPVAYADELRAAAGFGPSRAPAHARRPSGEVIDAWFDAVRTGLLGFVDLPALKPAWDVLVAARPAWWVLRGAVAATVVGLVFGLDFWTYPLMVAGAAASVQVGRGVLWPGKGRGFTRGVVLLALNTFALLFLPYALSLFTGSLGGGYSYAEDDIAESYPERFGALTSKSGSAITNVFAYDAQGKPLQGIQLFDQDGNPISISGGADEWECGEGSLGSFPWFNGTTPLDNVFPRPVGDVTCTEDYGSALRGPDAWNVPNPPVLRNPPLSVVPPATLPNPVVTVEPSAPESTTVP